MLGSRPVVMVMIPSRMASASRRLMGKCARSSLLGSCCVMAEVGCEARWKASDMTMSLIMCLSDQSFCLMWLAR